MRDTYTSRGGSRANVTYIHTYIHTHIHTCIHTYTHITRVMGDTYTSRGGGRADVKKLDSHYEREHDDAGLTCHCTYLHVWLASYEVFA